VLIPILKGGFKIGGKGAKSTIVGGPSCSPSIKKGPLLGKGKMLEFTERGGGGGGVGFWGFFWGGFLGVGGVFFGDGGGGGGSEIAGEGCSFPTKKRKKSKAPKTAGSKRRKGRFVLP